MPKMIPQKIDIVGCRIVPILANRDARGYLSEIFRESWGGAFPAVQWNACSSSAGVVRGVHVHAGYHEFYTLPKGRVEFGLIDIRRDSPTFRNSVQFEWTDNDDVALVVPKGVAHAVNSLEDSLLICGLSAYWEEELEMAGCQLDDPELDFKWRGTNATPAKRDPQAVSFNEMVTDYERLMTQLESGSEELE